MAAVNDLHRRVIAKVQQGLELQGCSSQRHRGDGIRSSCSAPDATVSMIDQSVRYGPLMGYHRPPPLAKTLTRKADPWSASAPLRRNLGQPTQPRKSALVTQNRFRCEICQTECVPRNGRQLTCDDCRADNAKFNAWRNAKNQARYNLDREAYRQRRREYRQQYADRIESYRRDGTSGTVLTQCLLNRSCDGFCGGIGM